MRRLHHTWDSLAPHPHMVTRRLTSPLSVAVSRQQSYEDPVSAAWFLRCTALAASWPWLATVGTTGVHPGKASRALQSSPGPVDRGSPGLPGGLGCRGILHGWSRPKWIQPGRCRTREVIKHPSHRCHPVCLPPLTFHSPHNLTTSTRVRCNSPFSFSHLPVSRYLRYTTFVYFRFLLVLRLPRRHFDRFYSSHHSIFLKLSSKLINRNNVRQVSLRRRGDSRCLFSGFRPDLH